MDALIAEAQIGTGERPPYRTRYALFWGRKEGYRFRLIYEHIGQDRLHPIRIAQPSQFLPWLRAHGFHTHFVHARHEFVRADCGGWFEIYAPDEAHELLFKLRWG